MVLAALGFEGGVGGINSATVARRGFTGWTLDVAAKQGHSSLIFSDEYGAGAIFEASRILDRFYQELQGEEYLTFGAGLILGGTSVTYDAEHDRGEAAGKTNVIPQAVTVAGDLRALTSEQVDILLQGNDVDELDGRVDPLWFKIESQPARGEFGDVEVFVEQER